MEKVFIPPEDNGISRARAFLAVRRSGAAGGGKKVIIETINGKPASQSEYD